MTLFTLLFAMWLICIYLICIISLRRHVIVTGKKRLIVCTTGNTFLQTFVTLCDAQNQPNKCNTQSRIGYMKLSLGLKKLVWSWVLQCGFRGSCNKSCVISRGGHRFFSARKWAPLGNLRIAVTYKKIVFTIIKTGTKDMWIVCRLGMMWCFYSLHKIYSTYVLSTYSSEIKVYRLGAWSSSPVSNESHLLKMIIPWYMWCQNLMYWLCMCSKY